MDMTRAEILYKIIKSPEHKFEMYLEVEECYKELNLQEVKAENLIKEIISKFEENTHEKSWKKYLKDKEQTHCHYAMCLFCLIFKPTISVIIDKKRTVKICF